jgi:hypothetical protein
MSHKAGSTAWKILGGLAASGLLGAVIGVLIRGSELGEVMRFSGDLSPFQWALLLAGAVVVVLAVLATHEAGHLLAGRLVGFRFLLFIAGPVRVAREGDRVRVGWNRSLSLAGGIAATGPTPDRLERLRERTAIMVAGGPVTSLLAGLAVGALYLAAGPGDAAAGGPGVLPKLALIFALASLAIAVVTLFPGRASGFLTDGARLLQLLRGGPRAEADAALVALIAWSLAGVRPGDWDPDLVERALRDDDGPFHATGLHYAWRHAADAGDEEAAASYRKALLGRLHEIPGAARSGILLDLATDTALAGDAAQAELLLEEAGEGGPLDDGFQRPLAEAALAAVDGRPEEARARADRAEALLDRAMDASAAAPARERIERIRAMAASFPE